MHGTQPQISSALLPAPYFGAVSPLRLSASCGFTYSELKVYINIHQQANIGMINRQGRQETPRFSKNQAVPSATLRALRFPSLRPISTSIFNTGQHPIDLTAKNAKKRKDFGKTRQSPPRLSALCGSHSLRPISTSIFNTGQHPID